MTRLVSTLVLSVVAVLAGLGLAERQLGVRPSELWRALADSRSVEPEDPARASAAEPPTGREVSREVSAGPPAAPLAPVEAPAPKPEPRAPRVSAPAPEEPEVEEPAAVVVIEPDRPFSEGEGEVAAEPDVWVEPPLVAGAGDNPDQDEWANLIRRMLTLYRHTSEPQ